MNKKLIFEKGGYRPTISGPVEPPTSVRSSKEDMIEKLAMQTHENLRSAGKKAKFNYEFADEFAKLIIEECMKVVEDQIKDLMENIEINPKICGSNSYEHAHGYLCCGIDNSLAIHQHFYPIKV
jgi:hypothetical protein